MSQHKPDGTLQNGKMVSTMKISLLARQCCGSGDPWIRDENAGSYFSEFIKTIFWVKILRFFDVDPDPGSGMFLTLVPGSGMEKIRIRDKYPGSATLLLAMNFVSLGQIQYSRSMQVHAFTCKKI